MRGSGDSGRGWDGSARGLGLDARDPLSLDHRHEVLDALRADDPVHLDAEHDRVVLTCAADVAATLADRTLSADPFKARATAYSRRGLSEAERGNGSMLVLDDPDHARLRGLVTQAFTAHAVDRLAPHIERTAAALLDAVDPGRPFDLLAAYAVPLPILTIAALLGIDGADAAQFKRWSMDLQIVPASQRTPEEWRRRAEARDALNRFFARAIAEHRSAPSDDLLSTLAAAEAEGDSLSEAEILNTCRLLLVAGIVTTTELIGNGAVALLRHPEQGARLRAEPDLWPAAVEEILRHDPPIAAWSRQALDARTIGGCPVEAGQTVTAMLSAANRDPALHADPHAFDVGREHQRHFSFGGGAHFCLGASLARLEGRIGLSALFERFPGLRLDPDHEPRRKAHPIFGGYEAVRLRCA